ncbi:type II toxin-antitoxin system RnlA family toxin [Calidifontibacillus oryziterrae]|uniref:type II toxin-antitoxin system RnlA family toxin n=1 Tax=Calidifontibacillus oryziterrae TaxID=1191699 RepID=UPI0002EA08FD|nr:type II toxin-antitoxin system RnlA family toxin [Calidifontibacillus oryziterrae]
MAKGLYINREQLEAVINANCSVKQIEFKNPAQGFYRYHVEKESIEFYLDVFFTKKGTTTVLPNCQNGQELEQAIINSLEYTEVRSGSFSAKMSREFFESLINYLRDLPSISVSDAEDKGNNGIIYRVKTNFGDFVTLTYFQTTSRMLYQGLLMKLYSIIKSYLLTLQNTISETDVGEKALADNVQQHLKMNFPKGWGFLEPTLQGFIKDSFTLVEVNTKLSDYAAWVMPVMRVLEYRIKKICLDYSVILDETKGFKYYTNTANPRATAWIFTMDFATDTVTGINPSIGNMPQDAKDTLVNCYDFLRKNRHEMFHATQILAGMKLVESKEAALQIIIEACENIEKSLVYNLKQIN